MILEFDLGNSSAKWRCLDEGGEVLVAGRAPALDEGAMAEVAAAARQPGRVRVASVAAAERERWLAQWCRRNLGVEAEFARTAARCAGVVNSYQEPERMGVDRWLAMLAAWRHTRAALLVIDLGSALTIDRLDGEGRHVGGFIIPGRRLMRQALLTETERVRFVEPEGAPGLEPGRSTAEAVYRGIHLALCGAVGLELAREPGGAVFLTGGDAWVLETMLRERLGERLSHVPDLVMDGLALALPQTGE